MLGECMNPHLLRLWAQEAAIWTAVYLGNIYRWWRSQGRGGTHYFTVNRIQCNTCPTSVFRRQPVLEAGNCAGLGQRPSLGCYFESLLCQLPSFHSGFCLPSGVSFPHVWIPSPIFQLTGGPILASALSLALTPTPLPVFFCQIPPFFWTLSDLDVLTPAYFASSRF